METTLDLLYEAVAYAYENEFLDLEQYLEAHDFLDTLKG